MKKALAYGPCDIAFVEIPERTLAANEARAKVLLTTLTTANVRLYQGPLVADLKYPVTLSYTAVCEVTEVGSEVVDLAPGDRVFPNFYRACLECDMCRADRMVACRKMPLGAHNMMVGEQYESGLQEEIVMPARRFRRIPPGASIEAAAMAGYASVAMQAVTNLSPQPWDTVAITGAGMVGLCALQLCKLFGAKVVSADILPERLELARQFGADAAVDVSGEGGAERVIDACGGPAMKVIELTGQAEGSKLAYDVAGRGASLSVVGVTQAPVTQHYLILKGLTVTGIGGAVKVDETLRLIADGRLDMSPLITHRFPFSQLKDAFELKRSTPTAGLAAIYVDESRLPAA